MCGKLGLQATILKELSNGMEGKLQGKKHPTVVLERFVDKKRSV